MYTGNLRISSNEPHQWFPAWLHIKSQTDFLKVLMSQLHHRPTETNCLGMGSAYLSVLDIPELVKPDILQYV
jgi:hypothetical protein